MKKLELTWHGKNEPFEIEPRILLEDSELSNIEQDIDSNNMLIEGDNLLALKALEKEYTGKVKCIYIDPPYNTGSAFDHYDDNLEHSIWLNLMKHRLEILKNLMEEGGTIVIQIDDNEQAYLKVMCDEIFGRKNFVNTICVKMSDASGPKMAHVRKKFPKLKEYLLIYKKGEIDINVQTEEKETWDSEYKNFIDLEQDVLEEYLKTYDQSKLDEINKILPNHLITLKEAHLKYGVKDDANEQFNFNKENAWRIARTSNAATIRRFVQEETNLTSNIALANINGETMFVKANFNRNSKEPRVQYVFAKDTMNVPIGDLWLNINTSFNSEGGVTLKNGQKPEALIKTIIAAFTNPGDLVLDSFLGSGTTAAVAHKMGRRWIGIEMGEHSRTLAKVRLDSVIAGKDKSGITNEVNWKGGGGYKFYNLAPSLINLDKFGEPIINEFYDVDLLAAAVALHEGFNYNPNQNVFWKQSQGNENSYLFVTTRHMTYDYVVSISETMKTSEYLIISCKSYDIELEKKYKNIIFKKIPDSILNKCEFGKKDYKLNIVDSLDESGEF